MLISILLKLFTSKPTIPDDFARMVKAEYRSVPMDYVEHFLKENKRLPSPEELKNAI